MEHDETKHPLDEAEARSLGQGLDYNPENSFVGDLGSFTDVTEFLKELQQELAVGEMIHGKEFKLFEAMSALELMDPKMDAGMNYDDVMTLEKALKQDLLPKDLTPGQLIGIFDELVACEMAWYDGSSVAHSVFTCMYLHEHDEPLITNPIFKAYANCLLKGCSLVMKIVTTADIYDEEEFTIHQFSFKLDLDDLNEEKVTGALDVEIEKLKEKACELKGSDEGKLYEALLARVEFRRTFFLLHQNLFAAPELRHKGYASVEETLTRAGELLASMRATVELGSTPAPGFDISIAKLLITNAPPRQTPIMSRSDTFSFLETIFAHFQNVLLMPHLKDYKSMVYFLLGLGSVRSNVVVRSHIFLLMNTDKNWMGFGRPLSKFIKDDHCIFCPTTKTHFDLPDTKTHLERLAHPLYSQFRLYCESPPRQLRRIGQLLDDWDILQRDAAQIDSGINMIMAQAGLDIHSETGPYQYAFFSWTYDQTLQLLVHYITLSLEIKLFANYELHYVFLYLDHLIDLRLQIYAAASLVPNMTPVTKKRTKGQKGGGKKNKKRNKRKIPKQNPRPHYYAFIESTRCMARGTHLTIQAFTKLDLLKFPKCPFGSNKLRYEHRFHEFGKVMQPELLPYESIEKTMAAPMSVERIIDEANTNFQNVRSLLVEYIKGSRDKSKHPWSFDVDSLRSCVKVAVANSTMLKSVKRLLQQKNKEWVVKFNFDDHRIFPIVGLKAAANVS